METQIQDTVFKAELGALLDAWRLRFGTNWVTTEELDEDAFFKEVASRLAATPHLEWYLNLRESAKVRLVERW